MQGYCSHGIVAHNKVSQANGAVSDAWACCDCGMRFMPDASLPTFAPEPSWLHKKLVSCVEHEREACAKVCETFEMEAQKLWDRTADPEAQGRGIAASDCAEAIRARGQS